MVSLLLLLAAYISAAHTLTSTGPRVRSPLDNVLTCQSGAQPVPNAEWRKDGEPFSVSTERVRIIAGKVLFNPVLPEDEGDYSCGGPPFTFISEFR